MTKTSRLDAGTIVAGRYRVEREIGRGGMAQVYEARHTDIGKGVAVKVLAAEFASSPVVVERFLREARAAAAVHSPYICDVYDSGKLDDGRPFLVMELLKGESLYERMVKIRQFDAETTARIVTHVSRGLMKAHAANIVHRDLKPENIFLTVDEEGDLRAKVLDFGLAKFYAPTNDGDAASARLTREGAIFGTPAYMSPEQVQGQGTVDHRADLWALGCIAYECLTGRTVWATDKGIAMTFAQIASAPLPRISRYRPDLPDTIEAWFDRALARDPDVRFQTAKELAEHFNGAINQGSPSLMFGEISRVGPSPITDEMRRMMEPRPIRAARRRRRSGGRRPASPRCRRARSRPCRRPSRSCRSRRCGRCRRCRRRRCLRRATRTRSRRPSRGSSRSRAILARATRCSARRRRARAGRCCWSARWASSAARSGPGRRCGPSFRRGPGWRR